MRDAGGRVKTNRFPPCTPHPRIPYPSLRQCVTLAAKLFVFSDRGDCRRRLGVRVFAAAGRGRSGEGRRGGQFASRSIEDGKTRIREKYVVSAPLNGRILRISMDPGDEVEAGKTLLTMIEPRDPELLDARSVAQAEARVKAAEATLRQVEPILESVRAGQSYAESEVTRMRQAFEGKGVSQSEVESAEMLNRQRSEDLRSAKLSEEIAKFELDTGQGCAAAFAAATGRHSRQGAC